VNGGGGDGSDPTGAGPPGAGTPSDGDAAPGWKKEAAETSPEGTEARAEPRGGAPSDPIYYCDLCGARMLDLHCKLICEQCGYKRDCSDP
jgi:hypothetical protein